MGLFDVFRKGKTKKEGPIPGAKRTSDGSSIAEFYNDCVIAYHETAMNAGLATRGVIFIPELIPIGEKVMLAFFQDHLLQESLGGDPVRYYHMMVKLAVSSGLVCGARWHLDYDGLKAGYVDKIIEEGPFVASESIFAQLGLKDLNKQAEFYMDIFQRWLTLHKPYWELRDPRNYTFMATLAAYQLGVSMVLEKYGY